MKKSIIALNSVHKPLQIVEQFSVQNNVLKFSFLSTSNKIGVKRVLLVVL